ncbi:MAG TPA: PAS domain-containing protein [Candidatus Thermoplasmatota archaeon]|nr:PAS domain-containing protein [Candidatus Thermoplasmatota archaeon]
MLANDMEPARRLRDVGAYIAALSESLTAERVAEATLSHALALTGARAAFLAHFDGARPALAPLGAVGFAERADLARLHDSPDSPLVEVARTHMPVFIDARATPQVSAPRLADGTLPQSLAFVPLVTRRRCIAALALAFDAPASFDAQERALVELLAAQAALALERSKLHMMELAAREGAEEENSRFRSLVQELDAIFWEADPVTFQFSFVSQRAERLLGYPLEDWKRPGFWADKLHPDDRHWAVDFCVQCTKEGQDHAFEYRMITASGGVLWLRDVVYVIRGPDGSPARLRGVMVDVTRDRERSSNPFARIARRVIRARPAP